MPIEGFDSLGDVLRRLGITLPDSPLPPEPLKPEHGCSRCRDAGWLSRGGDLVECPCGLVQQRRTDMIFAHSQVPERMRDWTLDSFAERSGKHDLAAAVRAAWDTGDRWLLLLGPVGTGKTGIGLSLLNEQLRAGLGGLYIVAPTMLTFIRASYDGVRSESGPSVATEAAVMSSIAQTPLLLLDDVGTVRLSDWGQEKLYTIVNERFVHGRRTIITSNLEVESLEQHLWPATMDRIRGMADVFGLTGRSLR